MHALVLLSLFSLPAFADSLDCDLQRGQESLTFSAPISDGAASAATKEANELGLGLDSSLSPSSYLVVLQDNQKNIRAAFTGSPEAISSADTAFINGDSRVTCRSKIENPPKVMPSRPSLPDYLICVLDEVKYVNGEAKETKRLVRKAMSTPLFKFPQTISAEVGNVKFSVALNRMDFRKGLNVSLMDNSSGAQARFHGPAATLRSSFMLALTQGDRATNAGFLRLGCVFAPTPTALD